MLGSCPSLQSQVGRGSCRRAHVGSALIPLPEGRSPPQLRLCSSFSQAMRSPSWTTWRTIGWALLPGPPCRRTARSSCRSLSSPRTPPSSWPRILVRKEDVWGEKPRLGPACGWGPGGHLAQNPIPASLPLGHPASSGESPVERQLTGSWAPGSGASFHPVCLPGSQIQEVHFKKGGAGFPSSA